MILRSKWFYLENSLEIFLLEESIIIICLFVCYTSKGISTFYYHLINHFGKNNHWTHWLFIQYVYINQILLNNSAVGSPKLIFRFFFLAFIFQFELKYLFENDIF